MHSRWLRLVLLLLTTPALACDDAATEPVLPDAVYDFAVSVNATEVSLSTGAMLAAEIRNRSNRRVYLDPHHFVVFERLQGASWVSPMPWFVADCFCTYTSLDSGRTRSSPGMPLGYISAPGTYRFRFLVYKDSRLREPFPHDDVASPPFVVVP